LIGEMEMTQEIKKLIDFDNQEDLEGFAQYLGIDYEDYVNMELGFDETLYELDEDEVLVNA